MKNGIIEIESEGLELELEKILWRTIERAQIMAHEEGFKYLMGFDPLRFDFEDFILGWGTAYGPDKCYLCGRFFACRPQYWYFDANGNIVHENCYHRG